MQGLIHRDSAPFLYLPFMIQILFLAAGLLLAPKPDVAALDQFVDNWHKQAAEANFEAYFEPMDENFVYIGTAPGERWNKTEFAAFAKPYFDRGRAWEFKPKDRKWNFSADGKTAWFDEVLDTWMRDCRGSGVVMLTDKGWKLMFYDLHVLIENEKIDDFLKLRDQQK